MTSDVEGVCTNENGKRLPQWRKYCLDWFSNNQITVLTSIKPWDTKNCNTQPLAVFFFLWVGGWEGNTSTKHQSGRSWQALGERKKCLQFFRRPRFANLRSRTLLLRYLLFYSGLFCLNLGKRKLSCIQSSIKSFIQCGKIAYVRAWNLNY